jgi:anti-sigma factor RsiW
MHGEYTALMSSVLDHEAEPEEAARLDAHLASCPECAATWEYWRSLDECLSAMPVLVPPDGIAAGVAARLAERRLRSRQRRWYGSGLLLAWAGSLVALWLALLGMVGWCLAHPSLPGAWAAASLQMLGGLARALDGLRSALGALGLLPVSLGVGSYLCVTALAAGLWLWLMWRKSAWAQALAGVIAKT